MNLRMHRIAAAATLALTMSGMAVAVSSTAASAAVCTRWGTCPTVKGVSAASPYLNIRSGPGTGYASIGKLNFGSSALVGCYSTGTPVMTDQYWDLIDVSGLIGYVSDYWLNTGGNITSQVLNCSQT